MYDGKNQNIVFYPFKYVCRYPLRLLKITISMRCIDSKYIVYFSSKYYASYISSVSLMIIDLTLDK